MPLKLAKICALLTLVLGACSFEPGLDQGGANRRALSSERGVHSAKAFDTHVYPILREQCASCHTNQNLSFATRNREDSYMRVYQLVNWDDLGSSRIADRKQDRHCGTNCRKNDDLLSALEKWQEALARDRIVEPDRIITAEVVMQNPSSPGTLPSGENNTDFVELAIPLASLGDDFAGAFLRVEVQRFAGAPSSSPMYRIRKPRIQAGLRNLFVISLKPLLNGRYQASNNLWTEVEAPVAAGEAPLLSPLVMLVAVEKGIGIDRLSFELGSIAAIDAIACRRLDLFQSTILPIMTAANKCTTCHTAVHPRWKMQSFLQMSDGALCNSAIQRVSLQNPAGSAIFNPFYGHNLHPIFNGNPAQRIMTDDERLIFLEWINAEIPASAE